MSAHLSSIVLPFFLHMGAFLVIPAAIAFVSVVFSIKVEEWENGFDH